MSLTTVHEREVDAHRASCTDPNDPNLTARLLSVQSVSSAQCSRLE